MNASDDCYGTLTSQGYNLIGSGTGCTPGANDQATTNAQLGPLANNGGETPTHALLASSPAINRVPPGTNGCVANTSADQRGAVRAGGTDRGGDRCDIGAYENASLWTPNAIALQEFSSHSSRQSGLIWLVGLTVLALASMSVRRLSKPLKDDPIL